MEKSREDFVACLSRDWVVNKIENIAGVGKHRTELEDEDDANEGAAGGRNEADKNGTSAIDETDPKPEAQYLPEAAEILQKSLYAWSRRWTIVRGRDGMYLWSDAVALELSNGSNGWFRYILNGTLSTMYSSGSPEGGSESTG